ncbi:MAG: FprA family A-type flavoprotein [Candidatus Bathyarchaeia archaeon]
MKKAVKISDSVYWVGALDYNLRNFHGIAAPEGGTYNSYLILNEEIFLIDTVKHEFFKEHLERISSVINPSEIDYVISNHSEIDHSGSIQEILKIANKAKLVTTEKGKKYLSKIFNSEFSFLTVKDNDEIKNLKFIEAPMLHWPETMMTYMKNENILFSCDLFGAQIADSRIFADLIPNVMSYVKRYYAFIFRPFAYAVLNGLKKLEGLNINIIAPSHGPVWRTQAQIKDLINAYAKWSVNPEKEKAVVLYAGIWGATRKIAEAIADGLSSLNIEVKIYDLTNLTLIQWSDLMADLMEAKAIAIGSNTLIGQMFPTVKTALQLLKYINPKEKIGLVFGSYGWVGGAVKAIENELKNMGLNLIDSIEIQFNPNENEIEKCFKLGEELAKKVKEV